MSDLEEVQLMVTADAGKTGSLRRGHKHNMSTGSVTAKLDTCLNLLNALRLSAQFISAV